MSLSDQAWPCLCDWDDDGDLDMLVGGGYGWPRIVINDGTRSRPAYAEPQRILADGQPIRLLRDEILGAPPSSHNMGYPYPEFIDWDADGLKDLILPNETNRIFWYRNIGLKGQTTIWQANSKSSLPALLTRTHSVPSQRGEPPTLNPTMGSTPSNQNNPSSGERVSPSRTSTVIKFPT